MDNISKSLFSLCKSNNGLFKSEKQAKYLQSAVEGNTWFCSKSYNLGSFYNFKQCGSADFLFKLDNAGIVEVTKTTSKGKKSVFFKRIPQAEFEAVQAEKEKRIDYYKAINLFNDRILYRIEQLKTTKSSVKENYINEIMQGLSGEKMILKGAKVESIIKKVESNIERLNNKLKSYD